MHNRCNHLHGSIGLYLVLLAWVLLASGGLLHAAEPAPTDASNHPIETGPVPDWVEARDFPATSTVNPAGSPAEILLSDAQDRLTPEGCDYFYRVVIHLLNAEGVRQNAEWTAVYSPETEKVTWNTLRITRDGRISDRLPSAKFKPLQRELGLEAKLLNGEITAVTVIDDVRVGDVLEVAYTTHQANPLLKGNMLARHYLGSRYPVRRQSILVRMPLALPKPAWSYFVPPGTKNLPEALFRQSALRSALDSEDTGEERLYRWSAESVPAVIFDDMIPANAAPYYPMIRCGTFKTWAAVVDWAEPLFARNGELPEDICRLAARWKTEFSRPEDRVRAAVRWVQNDIRYFAMAISDHNLRPRPLPDICESRFGDCKDKSTLLVALLRELDVNAWPALVNTYWQDRIVEYGPDPYAFNHAIVAYLSGNELRWIDPTLKHQRDVDGKWAIPPYRSALILRPDEVALTQVPDRNRSEPDSCTLDLISVDPTTGTARLTTTVTLDGLQADYYRQVMESVAREETSARWFNFIGRFYKKLEEVESPVVRDDEKSNRIIIRAVYQIPGFHKQGGPGETAIEVHAYMLRSQLNPVESRRRRWPYALAGDRFIRHRIELDLPFEVVSEQHPQVIRAEGVEYRVETGLTGRHFSAVHDLRFAANYVPADRMSPFSDAVDEILVALGTTLRRPPAAPVKTQPAVPAP